MRFDFLMSFVSMNGVEPFFLGEQQRAEQSQPRIVKAR